LPESEIDLIEDKLGVKLPEDIRLSYRLHNGQDSDHDRCKG